MAITEQSGLLTYKDEAGETYLLYPVTKAECVDGLEEAADPAGSAEAVQDNLDTHAGDEVKHITAAERTGWNAKGTPYRYTGTLTAAGWTDTGPYTQTVNVPGVTADMTPVADVVLTGDKDADTLVLESWACVSRMTTAAGTVTAVYYEDKPGVNVPVSLTGCK